MMQKKGNRAWREAAALGKDELSAAYLDLMMDEPGTELRTFMERVAAGRYGHHCASDIRAFLHDVERNIIGSIQTRAATNPRFAEQAEERAETTRAEIAELVGRFAAETGDKNNAGQN